MAGISRRPVVDAMGGQYRRWRRVSSNCRPVVRAGTEPARRPPESALAKLESQGSGQMVPLYTD